MPAHVLVGNVADTAPYSHADDNAVSSRAAVLGIEPDMLFGDANGDGEVDTVDAMLVLQFATYLLAVFSFEANKEQAKQLVDSKQYYDALLYSRNWQMPMWMFARRYKNVIWQYWKIAKWKRKPKFGLNFM